MPSIRCISDGAVTVTIVSSRVASPKIESS
jgi:hypothetical protein